MSLANSLLLSIAVAISSSIAFGSDREMEEAKESAPDHITENATYMVWKENRFETVVEGTNEFVCLVIRDPKGRFEPSCLNRAAMKSVFPVYELEMQMLFEGAPIEKVRKAIEEKARSGEFPKPEPGALVYMMSPRNKWYDYQNNALLDLGPHIMLYYPTIPSESLGFNNEGGLPMFYQEYPHLSVVHIHTDPAHRQ